MATAGVLALLTALTRADDFDTLITGWARYFTGGTNINVSDPNISSRITSVVNTANNWWSSMDKSAGRTYLWSDLASSTSESQISAGYDRLADMAQAWAMTGSPLKGNTNLAADIVSGLDWMYANRYNETVSQYGNWWYWVIGIPYPLNNAMVLMYPRLSGTQITNYCKAIDKFVRSVVRDSANRVWECRSIGIRGAVGRNAAKVAAARDGLTDVFPYVTSGNGFYTDGSYLFHGAYPYTGGYGNSLLIDLAKLMDWLAPTAYAVTDSQRTNVIQWLYDSYEPLVYCGAIAEHVRGREIARSYATGYGAGHAEMNAIFRVAQTAPTNDALRLKSMVKYWDQVDTTATLASYADIDLVDDAGALLTNSVPLRGELIGHYQFPSMDRVMHLRPGFGFTLSMFSSRTFNYESINGENLHGWFTSQGMSYLLTTNDITQFTDQYWPTVDPYHLPGTTVVVTPLADSVNQGKKSTQPWVGGAVLSNFMGAAGMSLDDVNSTLAAKKSWFMFDNEVVCLGAGISCSSATNVHTTVENRSLHTGSTSSLTVNGTAMPTTLGWSSNLNNVTWCALAGSGGYYFPGGASLKAARTACTGTWDAIGLSSGSYTRNYVSLILDHGIAPANATYAYVLLPNCPISEVSAYAAKPHITVLTNTSAIQAARGTTLGVTAANFWATGGGSVDFITCNQPAAVLTRETNGLLEVAVSDPTWTNSSTITLTLNRSALSLVSADAGVTVVSLAPKLQLSMNVSGARGQTLTARFALSSTLAANPDAAATGGSTPLAIDVLANDISNTGTITITNVAKPAHGVTSIVNQEVWYVPAANFTGTDTFNYFITDGARGATGTLSVAVGGPMLAISTGQVSASEAQADNPAVNVLDGDLNTRWSAQNVGMTSQWIQFDLLSTQLVSGVGIAFYQGAARTNYFSTLLSGDAMNWTTSLTNASSSGASTNLQSFSFPSGWARYVRILGLGNSQGTGWNSFTEVRILAGTNAAPVALNDSVTLVAGSAVTVNVLANDSDPDHGPQSLTLLSFTQPAHGSVTGSAEGLNYEPSVAFSGADSFSYVISDSGLTATGWVAVAVTSLPPLPATIGSAVAAGTNLILVWVGGNNRSSHLLSATNITSARSNWTLCATNWAGADGRSTNTIPVNPAEPQRFYLLSMPYN